MCAVRAALVLTGLLLSSGVLVADDRTVLFDHDVDFSVFKTFTLRDGAIDSRRPELNSPITSKKLTDAIRAALTTRGLKDTSASADLVVQYKVTAVDYGIGPFGRANPIGGRGRRGEGAQASTPDFTDATLVIDLMAGNPPAMVWRGVYRDTKNNASKLAEALPKQATSLLSDYPPKKKK
jgi:uncharacterized protein DUF4136